MKIDSENSSVLVLAPHTDDGEFGCGGAIAHLISRGARVVYIAFSAAEQSVLPDLPSNILRSEVRKATSKLGIKDDDCIVLDFPVRRFPEYRQEILDAMIKFNEVYKPDLVFLPSGNDTHQDHQTVASEGFRAFKKTTMLGYEVPWNNLQFNTTSFISLTRELVEVKVQALSMYESQRHRDYASSEFIWSLAKMRGVQIGKEYAESFEVVRWVQD